MPEYIKEQEIKSQALYWSPVKQDAMVGHLILDAKFFTQIKDTIKPEWFTTAFSQRIVGVMQAFYNKYGHCPTEPELKECKEFALEEANYREKLYTHIGVCKEYAKDFSLDSLRDELSDWMQSRTFASIHQQAVGAFNAQKPQEAYALLEEGTKKLQHCYFGKSQEVRFDEYTKILSKEETLLGNALTIGLAPLDKIITPQCTSGSLLPGETTLIVAPFNIGKTTTLITIACHNIKAKKPVLFLVHEDRAENIYKKVWCNLLNVSSTALMSMYKTPGGCKDMDYILKNILTPYFHYEHLVKAGNTVEEVVASIRRLQEERIRKFGEGFAMICDDYPFVLGSSKHFNTTREKHEYVFNQFVDLALELNLHVVAAQQTNREGAKINRNIQNKMISPRLITAEDAGESIAPAQRASTILTVNRDTAAMRENRITFYLCKGRQGAVGYAFVCKSHYNHYITHGDTLGCTWYHGDSPMNEKIAQFLEQYKGQEIPQKEYAYP